MMGGSLLSAARSYRGRAKNDRGLTLVELLVAMALTALLATMVIGFFVGATHSTNIAKGVDSGTRQASNGMNELTRMIRAATPNPLVAPVVGGPQSDPAISLANGNSITLYAYVNLTGAAESPVMVNFAVNANGQLVEKQWTATTTTAGVNGHWTFNTGTPQVTRILCDSIPASAQLFHYISAAGVEITPVPGSNATTLATVASVQVVLTVKPAAANPLTLTNTIGMANIGFGSGS